MKAFKVHSDLSAAQDCIENYEHRTERGQGNYQLKAQSAAMLRRIAQEMLEYADEIDPSRQAERET